jgi:hypothetical protein
LFDTSAGLITKLTFEWTITQNLLVKFGANMKLKLVCAVVLSAFLSACGGHGFEGKWKIQMVDGTVKLPRSDE